MQNNSFALKMSNNEKTKVLASLLCCDRGGLIVSKQCLLPNISPVIDTDI